MSVVFNPNEPNYYRGPGTVSSSGLVRWFMKLTGLQSEAAANQILFVVSVIFLVTAGVIFWVYL